ncbi:MAG: Rrf2 family transcriptional regulator [Amphritea sp.]
MQLSRFTDYTLRVLFYVATNNDRLTTLSEIAGFYGISMEHLRKVVHSLAKSGYLKTFRGKHGGIKLAMLPGDINIGTVIGIAEGLTPLVDCKSQRCCLTPVCSLQGVLAEAQGAFMQTLQKYTLQDLLSQPGMEETLIARCST